MPKSLSDSTLEQFRAATVSPRPAPAGVTVAAVSVSFALGLLAKALGVSGRRKGFTGDPARLESLAGAAQAGSKRLLQFAADDTVVFADYLAAARMPQSSEHEQRLRQESLERTIPGTIELPLAAARETAAGLTLCVEACPLTPLPLIADLASCAALLTSGLRVFLVCAHSNVRQLAPDPAPYLERLAIEQDRQERALALAETVFAHVAGELDAPTGARL